MTGRLTTALLPCFWLAVSAAAAQVDPRPDLRATRATTPPVIDGALDDDVWQQAPLPTGEWLSYNPLFGDAIPQKTSVWFSYDSDFLYFAFKCDDPDPAQIKTSITRRDNIWNDDWVGLSLDALGTGQLSYHMMANPSGVQLDMLNGVAGAEDPAPDWAWDSAGRLTDTGYAVEIRLPLQSIRFRGGDAVRMGLLFWRRVSRSGVSVSWPPLSPGVWVFERHASLRFDRIEARLAREVLPSATYGRTTVKASPTQWGPADGRGNVGVSAKVGLTSTVTLDATVNPDFSQVESDAFQVEVNQRFPIFFAEKRPFFMEGAGIFTLAGAGGNSSLRTGVHTRRIVDPIAGAKVTGSIGRVTFGTLSASDDFPGRALAHDDPDHAKQTLFNVGRAQFSLGPGNYVGAIVTDVAFAGGDNRVAGADLSWRANSTQRLQAFALVSRTRAPGERQTTGGIAAQAGYSYNTRTWTVNGTAEHYDEDFAMETAFINRVGLTSGWAFVERSFYPGASDGWLRRAALASFAQGGRDRLAGGNELVAVAAIRFWTTRQGFLDVGYETGFEHWAGRRFDRNRPRTFGSIQLFRWLSLDGSFSTGDAVFYDRVDPFQGRSTTFNLGTTWQPNGRLSQTLGYERVAFSRASTGERVYTLNILNTKTTYQFTRFMAVRGIAQYDSSRNRVLTDFLGSYEPTPGTVAYVGYGSLIERRDFVDGRWIPGAGTYQMTQRGLFVKASYLYRFR
jgi:hypothetical protein